MADNTTSVEKLYSLYQQFSVVTTDSRKIPPKSIFFALKGENFDGNRFAAQALEMGAAFAVVDDRGMGPNDRYIFVANVLQSLQELARYHRQQLRIPVIGITGSNGKTTTKELVHAVLSQKYRTVATQGNLNNHIGVPLTLLTLREDTEIAVIEMGANHPGEIAFLSDLALPSHGLITNIGRAHLEGFGGFDGVVRAKTELYTFLRNHSGQAFLNIDDSLLSEHAYGLHHITYGLSPDAGTSGTIVPGENPSGPGSLEVEITFPHDRKQLLQTALFGSYNALNLLAAAAVGFHFKVPEMEIARALETYMPSNNRSQLKKTSRNMLILDAYNANPTSMAAALADFDRVFKTDKVVILGDMLELGDDAVAEHHEILRMVDTLHLQQVFLVGPLFREVNSTPEWRSFETSGEAAEWFKKNTLRDANILLKGSRGIHLEEILPEL
ncbi:MAG: UDP-N-acetylmuramoyl-tripeptide--D-alanyl-D-alanine ligase [Bacteroidales bacterium]|nr:UDP-N-acetylmuramoyl-tripeptide--D-alanyl-D-alanine ligase [Bacteroidales bacterium]